MAKVGVCTRRFLLCILILCLMGYSYLTKQKRQILIEAENPNYRNFGARPMGDLQSNRGSGNSVNDICLMSNMNVMAQYLSVWYKFVPHQNEMTTSNCWYAKNLNTLSHSTSKKMKELATFVDVPRLYSAEETEEILTHILKNGNKTLFSSNPTNHFFCLPKYYLIGFPKCGTTLLYKYIQSHPLFANPQGKEGQFWRELVRASTDQYRELEVLLYLFHFFSASRKIRQNPKMFTIDASASTVFAASQLLENVEEDMCFVPMLMLNTLPSSRFVIIMRDPIDRLWSDFWYFCPPSKWSGNTMHENAAEVFHNQTVLALQNFLDCIRGNNSLLYCVTVSGSVSGEQAACKSLRLGLSIYYAHVVRWLSLFPRNQILMIRIEDLISDPLKAMNEVWTFFEVPMHNQIISDRVNENMWITSNKYGTHFMMLQTTKDVLKKFFRPYNIMLAKLLGDERYLWDYE